jgi:hypothetical protein
LAGRARDRTGARASAILGGLAQSSTGARRGYPGIAPSRRRGEGPVTDDGSGSGRGCLSASLPNQLVGPRFVIPILEGILLIALVATDPRRITRQSRTISLVLIAVIVPTNLVALGH